MIKKVQLYVSRPSRCALCNLASLTLTRARLLWLTQTLDYLPVAHCRTARRRQLWGWAVSLVWLTV